MEIKGDTYEERSQDQIEKWVAGNSIHNQVDDECCPDFSCCNENVKTEQDQKELFLSLVKIGDIENMNRMMVNFLGQNIASKFPDMEVEIIDLNKNKQNLN